MHPMLPPRAWRMVSQDDISASANHTQVPPRLPSGISSSSLKQEFRFSIDDYLLMCGEQGNPPDKPFSGKIPLRISPEVHRAATAAAKADGKSLNAWLAAVVERAV